jgi:hypothetical protein
MWERTVVRKASRARAPDSPVPGEHMDVRMARPENKSPRKELNETHHEAEEARGKGGAGRDTGFALARPVLSWQDQGTGSRAICTVMPQIQSERGA